MSRPQMVYLHGFASSPRSSKAAWFTTRAREAGIPLVCPDLNGPEFETLTVSRMLEQVDGTISALPHGPVVLVGSSLGAVVALFAAERQVRSPAKAVHPVQALVFLAPAFDLVPGLEAHLGPERMAAWQRTGALDVFHYADNRLRTLGYAFVADARRYDAFEAANTVPTLIYQGRQDAAIDADMVRRWAAPRGHVTLHLLEDDHQLLRSLDVMWDGIRSLAVPVT